MFKVSFLYNGKGLQLNATKIHITQQPLGEGIKLEWKQNSTTDLPYHGHVNLAVSDIKNVTLEFTFEEGNLEWKKH